MCMATLAYLIFRNSYNIWIIIVIAIPSLIIGYLLGYIIMRLIERTLRVLVKLHLMTEPSFGQPATLNAQQVAEPDREHVAQVKGFGKVD